MYELHCASGPHGTEGALNLTDSLLLSAGRSGTAAIGQVSPLALGSEPEDTVITEV